MKEGWKESILGECFTIYSGNSINADYKKKNFTGLKDGYPFIGTKDVSFEGVIDYNNGIKIPFDTSYKIAEPNSVFLCAEGGSAGRKIAIVDQKVCFGNKLFCFRNKKNDVIGKYLYYYLLSDVFQKQFKENLTGLIGGVSSKKIQDIIFYYKSIPEQQQIVDFIDAEFAKIDELKNQAEQSLQNAKDLFQAALKEMLTPKEGWKECKMGNICELSQGLAINAKTRHLLVEKSSIPLLRIKDMKEGTREIFVDEKLFPPACLANKEDLIYTRTGTLGLIFTGMYGILHNNCFKIKIVEKDINKSFYMYFVGSDSFRTQITKLASRAAQPDITHKLFKEQLFQYPSISEQRDIVNKLNIMQERITALQSNYSRSIQLCADLKQALLRQVFE